MSLTCVCVCLCVVCVWLGWRVQHQLPEVCSGDSDPDWVPNLQTHPWGPGREQEVTSPSKAFLRQGIRARARIPQAKACCSQSSPTSGSAAGGSAVRWTACSTHVPSTVVLPSGGGGVGAPFAGEPLPFLHLVHASSHPSLQFVSHYVCTFEGRQLGAKPDCVIPKSLTVQGKIIG